MFECFLCAGPSHGHFLCGGCLADLPWHRDACPRCGTEYLGAPSCTVCPRQPLPWSTLTAVWNYAEPIRSLVHEFKYRGRPGWSPALAHCLLATLPVPSAAAHVTVLVPVPMHWSKVLRRGFNHAERLASDVARSWPDSAQGLQRPAPKVVLARGASRVSMAQLSAANRRQPGRQGLLRFDTSLAGHRVAIIDDVVTTGTTARRMAAAARAAGASDIEVWCLARTQPG